MPKLKLVLDRIFNRYERLRFVKIEKPDLDLNPSTYKKYFNNNSDKLVYKNFKSNQKSNFIYCNFSDSLCNNITLKGKDQIKLLKQNYKKKILQNITFTLIMTSIKGKIFRKQIGIKKYKNKIINNSFSLKYNEFINIKVDKEKNYRY